MKRLTALLLAMALCLGSIGAAKADGIDIKVKGTWDFVFGLTESSFREAATSKFGQTDLRSKNDHSIARQRVRTQIDFITSEYLSGVLQFEIGNINWGRDNGTKSGQSSGGDLDADGVNIETKRAYLDWIVPYTEVSVRMGIQGLFLPSGRMGNPVFTGDVAAIAVSSPITDWLSATFFWARPFDQYFNDDRNSDFGDNMSDETDMFGLILPMNFSSIGLSFTPWYVYSWVGANSGIYDYVFFGNYDNTVTDQGSNTKAWWIGANLGFTFFDPLEFNMDFMYGRLNRADIGGLAGLAKGTDAMAAGWYIGATLDYKLDFMTPGIFGWYASGDTESGANANRIGRLPSVGLDDGFMATTFGYGGHYSIGSGNAVSTTGTGTWGIGIQLADITFIEDLSHTLRFAYYRGTNDSAIMEENGQLGDNGWFKYGADALYLTDEDQVFEINFDHQYKIYENLTMIIELGYLHLKTDKDTWGIGNGVNSELKDKDDAWKAEVGFRYSF